MGWFDWFRRPKPPAPVPAPVPPPQPVPVPPAPTPTPAPVPAPGPSVTILGPGHSIDAAIRAGFRDIVLGAGTYIETLSHGAAKRTENGVTIRAQAGAQVIIQAPAGEGHFLYVAGSDWSLVGVTLKDFQPTNSGVVAAFEGSRLTLDGVQFVNCTKVADTTSHCIYIAGPGGGHQIVNSGCDRAAGSFVQFFHDPNSTGTRIAGCTLRKADQGVLIWAGAKVEIAACTFMGCRIDIRHHNSAGTTVTGCTSTGAIDKAGVLADTSTGLSQSGNSWQ